MYTTVPKEYVVAQSELIPYERPLWAGYSWEWQCSVPRMTHHGPLDGHRQSLGPGQQPVGGSSSLGSGRRAGGGHCLHRQHRHLLNTTYSCTEGTAVHLHSSIFTVNTF